MPHEMIIGSLAVPAPTHPPTQRFFGTAPGEIEFEAKIVRWISPSKSCNLQCRRTIIIIS